MSPNQDQLPTRLIRDLRTSVHRLFETISTANATEGALAREEQNAARGRLTRSVQLEISEVILRCPGNDPTMKDELDPDSPLGKLYGLNLAVVAYAQALTFFDSYNPSSQQVILVGSTKDLLKQACKRFLKDDS